MTYTQMLKNLITQTQAMWNNYDSDSAKYIKKILNQDKTLVQIKTDYEIETGGELFQKEISANPNFEKLAYRTYLILCIATESFDIVTLWNFSKTEWEMYGRWSRFEEAIENSRALRNFVEKAEPSSEVTDIITNIANESLQSIINTALGIPIAEETPKEAVAVHEAKDIMPDQMLIAPLSSGAICLKFFS